MTNANTNVATTDLTILDTMFTIGFDFTNAEQKSILAELQDGNYKLFGYKGAIGPGQISSGVPTWFDIPYQNLFSLVNIVYRPEFKVYVSQQETLDVNTILNVSAISDAFPLGTSLVVDSLGNFTIGTGNAPDGTISLMNNRGDTTPNITVGLAAYVMGEFKPFCAFTLPPKGSINMEPVENVLLFAAQTNLVSGTVTANATAPGCIFDFDSSKVAYELDMIPRTFGITERPGTLPVSILESGVTLTTLLNS